MLHQVVGLGELSHVIAGSVESLYAVVTGAGHFLIPPLLGNSIGGVSLVALLNHAQVAPEKG